ncbi:MAG TPA: MarR family transcriptional regulator [Desulfuromonadales bacterium]|nr:MarR family transcriptional regulator [Desulfuromonadales bacterium]
MQFFHPEQSIGFHCSLTFKAFRQAMEKRLEGTGISPVHFIALAHLIALGPLPQNALGEKLFITAPSTARLVDRMERDGWVERRPDPEDRRMKRVALTGRAEEVWQEVAHYAQDTMAQAYQGIDQDEIEQAIATLARVRRNLEDEGRQST